MQILKLAKSGKRKTQLMKEVNMSFLQAQQYLGILLDKSLLRTDDHLFITTKKGLEFVEKCEECLLCNWHQQGTSKRHV
jgi:predicted transcriptional regulator